MKELKDYNGYFASEDGFIYSAKSGELHKLIPHDNGKGYMTVGIRRNDGKICRRRVHRLVWEAFNGEIPNNMEINHINEVRDDNRLANLQILTHRQNLDYGGRTERHKKAMQRVYELKRNNLYEVKKKLSPDEKRKRHIEGILKNKGKRRVWNKGKKGLFHHSEETKRILKLNAIKQWNKSDNINF